MKAFTQKRRYVVAFTLLLALALGSFVYISAAAGAAKISIPSSKADEVCATDGAMAPTAFQGSIVSFSLSGYHANEGIAMEFTFPDGRVLDLPGVIALDGPVNILNPTLDDSPQVDPGGELYFTYKLSHNWPVGCYSIHAVGLSSDNQGKTELVIKPDMPGPGVPATLSVSKEADGAHEGQRGDLIVITGEGFGAGVHISISMKAPDGTIIAFPDQPLTSASGKFTTMFQFTQASLSGTYSFTAHGGSPDVQASADFKLRQGSF